MENVLIVHQAVKDVIKDSAILVSQDISQIMENACQNVRIKKLCKKIKVISVFGKIQFVMNMTKLTKENVVFVDKWIMIYF